MQKKYIKIICFLLLPCVALLALTGCKSPDEINDIRESQASKTTQEIVIKQELEREQRVLTVTGTGKVDVSPDLASVRLAVYVEADTAKEAQQRSSEIMDAVLTAVKAKGIADANIKTQEIVAIPQQDNAKNPPEITGYKANNTISLRILDVKRTGEIIDAAVQAGASVDLPLEFYLLDETKAYNDALAAAVADASEKAQIIAEAAGFALDGPLLVHEDYDVAKNSPEVLLYEGSVTPKQNTQSESGGEEAQPVVITPIQAGLLRVNAQVTVDFLVTWPAK